MESGGADEPFMRRQSNKRNFSTMAASSRTESLPRDDHYANEHAARRRRILPEPIPTRYPGDGFDWRRPVMSTSSQAAADRHRAQNATVIDLTDEDGTTSAEQSQNSDLRAVTSPTPPLHEAHPRRAQRLPRFGRNVMDEGNTGDEEREQPNIAGNNYHALHDRRLNHRAHPHHRPQYSNLRRPARPPTPPRDMDEFGDDDNDDEVQIVGARPTNRAPIPPLVLHRRHREATPYPAVPNEPIDLTEDSDDEIVHLDTRQRTGVNLDRPAVPAGVGTNNMPQRAFPGSAAERVANVIREGGHIGGRLMQRLQNVVGLDQALQAQHEEMAHWNLDFGAQARGYRHNDRRRHRIPHHGVYLNGGQGVRIMHEMPGLMDVRMAGFDLHTGGPARPPSPKYEKPEKPAKGFTRSPGEDEVVVCPNCGDELAMGESEVKQQIWVVKGCGHAYCGECAQHRGRGTSKKGKGKAPAFEDENLPPPFKKCVVEGCGKTTSAKAMIHVYLGS